MIGKINLPGMTIIDSSDATALPEDILLDKTAYVNAEKITGTMPNHGDEVVVPGNEKQTLPSGYYNSIEIEAGIDTSDATATENDILEGKTAYVNGEEITGIVPNMGNKVITPSDEEQVFPVGYYEGIKVEKQSGSGFDINGLIKEYEVSADGKISAGDFVEFLEAKQGGKGEDTKIISENNYGSNVSTCMLNENKVLIIHKGSNDDFLYGIVCTIKNNTIIVGTDTQLSSATNSSVNFSVIALDENRVFIAHSYGTNNYLYGIGCMIVDTAIVAGTDTQLSTITNAGKAISMMALGVSRIFIAHSYDTNNYLYGIMCDVMSTMVKIVGTDTQLSAEIDSGSAISAVKLEDNKIFIVHSSDNINYYLNGVICTISATTIIVGTDTSIKKTSRNMANVISAIVLDENRVFVAHNYMSSYQLYGIVCTIEGTTITPGKDTRFLNGTHTGYRISAIKLSGNENKIFIVHSSDITNHYLYGLDCIISETEITIETDTLLSSEINSGSAISAVLLKENTPFIAHSYGSDNYLYGIVPFAESVPASIRTLQADSKNIAGIATVDGDTGEVIEIKAPYYDIYGTGGAVSINGLIDEYRVAAGNNVNAGDFVKFLNDYTQTGEFEDTELVTKTNPGTVISAVALSENKVFIAYGYTSVFGIVCTIEGTSITPGTYTILNNAVYTGIDISAVILDENKVFIAYSMGNVKPLYGIVCNIKDTTITAGNSIQLSTTNYSGNHISAIALDENRVFIAHNSSNYNYLYGIVCTIEGTEITKGTDTSLSSTVSSGVTISAVKLSENKVFIAHSSDNTNYYLNGVACTISDTTITKGTDTAIASLSNAGDTISTVKLSEDKAFIAHSYGGNHWLYGVVCTIDGKTISKGTNTQLIGSNGSGVTISAIKLSENENKIFIAHSGSSYYLYGLNCEIDEEDNIILGNEVLLSSETNSGSTISACLVINDFSKEGYVFIGHSYGSDKYLYGISMPGTIEWLVKTITSKKELIEGVALQSGEPGDMIQAARPDLV